MNRTVPALALGLGLGVSAVLLPQHLGGAAVAAPPAPAVPALSYDPSVSLAPLVEAHGAAVVNLEVAQKVEMFEGGHPLAPFGFQMPEGDEEGFRMQRGAGSGFLISPDGYILTNNHVIDEADEVIVRLGDERELQAKVVGSDPRTDVALVKVQTDTPLPFVELGVSGDMKVGDWVVAIGNPFGLSNTVTAGIISAKGRIIGAGPYDDFIQTDASINPGNSGGPLFNLAGQVVGINTAINPYGQGIGFAVPIDQIAEILDELKSEGRVARGWIGVGLQDLDPVLQQRLQADRGVVISQVYAGTPAHSAGLEAGDVVFELDGSDVEESGALVRAVGSHKPGETIKLGLFRDGKQKQIAVKLGERPEEGSIRGQRWQPETGDDEAEAAREPAWGFTVREMGGKGLVVTEVAPDSPATGKLHPGDVVLEANRRTLKSGRDLAGVLGEAADGVLLVVRRGEAELLVTLEAPAKP